MQSGDLRRNQRAGRQMGKKVKGIPLVLKGGNKWL